MLTPIFPLQVGILYLQVHVPVNVEETHGMTNKEYVKYAQVCKSINVCKSMQKYKKKNMPDMNMKLGLYILQPIL